MTESDWHVIIFRPNQSTRAERNLDEVGFVKLGNFKRSNSKMDYMYLLTPQGLKAKLEITKRFLKNKQLEYDKLYNYLNE